MAKNIPAKAGSKYGDLYRRLIFLVLALVVYRIGTHIPVPGIDPDTLKELFNQQQGGILGLFNMFSGGALSRFSVFALGIMPYISASIIMQMLSYVLPSLESLRKEGESGRRKITQYTRYGTLLLGLFQALGIAVALETQPGLVIDPGFFFRSVCVISLVTGTMFLMWLGEQITEKGVGNGISIILLYNIVSRLPNDMANLYEKFIKGATTVTNGLLGAVIILAVLLGMVVFIIILSDGERRISVQYSKKTQGRKLVGGQSSHIPLKVNTAGVIPVIFAGSLFSMPIVIAGFAGIQPASGAGASFGQKILKVLNQNSWCNFDSLGEFKYTIGLVVYIVLLIFFAYFYTSITFNPQEIAMNMKKQGGFIPGIRPGKPTTDYLTKILNSIILLGAIGLSFVAVVPIFFSGAFGANVSFGGTSLIIIVGVVLETLKQVESQMLVRHYRGFISE